MYNPKNPLADKIRYTFNIGNLQAFVRRLANEAPDFQTRDRNTLPYETLEKVGNGAFTRIDSFGIPDQWIKGRDKFELGPITTGPEFLKELKLGRALRIPALYSVAPLQGVASCPPSRRSDDTLCAPTLWAMFGLIVEALSRHRALTMRGVIFGAKRTLQGVTKVGMIRGYAEISILNEDTLTQAAEWRRFT